jgi:DNA-binding MarR family transcriptional regulator
MGQLASKLMVTKGNITGVVRRLHEHRYVRQATSRTDRRVQVVTLTTKGRGLWNEMHAEYRAVIEDLMSPVSKAQAKALTENLIQVQQVIDCVLQGTEQTDPTIDASGN